MAAAGDVLSRDPVHVIQLDVSEKALVRARRRLERNHHASPFDGAGCSERGVADICADVDNSHSGLGELFKVLPGWSWESSEQNRLLKTVSKIEIELDPSIWMHVWRTSCSANRVRRSLPLKYGWKVSQRAVAIIERRMRDLSADG